MSKAVDERVVSMQFDNKHFESNVQTSMSTLDKLKQKLHLKGAEKGLDNVNKSARNVDMSPLASGVETVRAKFSALDVIGMTALSNITNAAVNAGMKMVKSLTIDPVMDGFKEYEMTINAVQTTMTATGKTAEEVESELKKLDDYADKTIYSTADMLNNLPKFTNAGVELETATKAMIGIANATAHAGGDASKASIAYYNLGQAMSTGYLTRMDYNSINNAGIATMKWKEQMVNAAVAAGTLKKAGDDAYEAGGKTFTLQQLFIDGLQEQWATTDVMTKVFGDYASETSEIGKEAWESATKVKTFSMMMDTLKATAGTGWKESFQIIFGGLEDASKLWTGLTNFISGIISKVDDYRNTILDLAFNNPFTKILDKIESVIKKTSNAAKGMQDLSDIVNRVIRGDFGNQWDNGDRNFRAKLVEAEGYEYAAVQNAVNEKLGSSVRLKTKDAEAQTELNKANAKGIEEILKMSDAELKKLGFTEEEIKMLRLLAEESKKSGKSVNQLMEEMAAEPDGRALLMEAFTNTGKGLMSVLKALGQAWKEVFPPESLGLKLYNLFKGFRDLSKSFVMTDETADKLKRTFKGVFAAVSVVSKIVAGPIKIAFKLLMAILKAFDVDVLGVTANIGDVIVKFNDWLDAVLDFDAVARVLVGPIKAIGAAIKSFFNAIKNSKAFTYFVDGLKKMGSGLSNWFKGLKDAENIPMYIIKGLANGLKNGATLVFKTIGYIAEGIINKVKDLLGIHSPSVVFMVIGGFIISGLIKGLLKTFPELDGALGGIISKISSVLGEIDWGGLFAGGSLTALLSMGYKLTNALTAPLDGVGEVLEKSAKPIAKTIKSVSLVVKNSAKVVKSFGKVLSAKAFKTRTEGLKDLAVALLLVVGAVAILTFFKPGELWHSVAVVFVLASILAGLAWAISNLSDSSVSLTKKDGLQIQGTMMNIMAIASALLIVALAAKLFSSIGNPVQAFLLMGAAVAALLGVLTVYGKVVDGEAAKNIGQAGKMIKKIGTSMLILALAAKLFASMSWEGLGKAGAAIVVLGGIIVGLIAATKLGGPDLDKAASLIGKVGTTILLLALAAKLFSSMSWEGLGKAGAAIVVLGGVIVGLIAATKLAGKDIDNIGRTILAISGAMLVLAFAAKIIAGMEWGGIAKAAVGLAGLVIIIRMMIMAVQLAGKDAPKIAATLLAMSVAIGVLALVAVLIGLVDTVKLLKGIVVIEILASIMSGMIRATKNANNPWKSILAMTAGIAVLAIALGVLSFCDPVKLLAAAASMGVVMAAFALMMSQLKKIKMFSDKSIYIQLGMLMGVVAIIAGILYLLRDIPADQSLGTALGISVVMLALSGCLVALNKVGGMSSKALMGVVGLLALCVPLVALVGILYLMQGIENAGKNALILAGFITVLTLCMIPLTLVGTLAASALLGVVGVLALCVPLVAIVGILALMEGIENADKNASLLMKLLVTMTAVLTVLAIIGPFALVGVAAITALSGLMVVMGVLATAVGALMETFPSLQKFVDTGINLLIKLAGGIGKMIGAFVGGIAAGLMAQLPGIGTSLSKFMKNAEGFIEGIKNVDSSMGDKVGCLVSAIIGLSVASFINGILSILSLGTGNLALLGYELSAFMKNGKVFFENASLINPGVALGMKYLSDAILTLTAGNLLNSITDWLFGSEGSTLEQFGSQLGSLGTSLRTFVDNIGTFDDGQVKTVECACKAVKALADVNNALPSEGGWWQAIAGEQMDIGTFASKFPAVANGVRGFIENLGTFGDDQLKTAETGVKVISAIGDAASALGNTGGWWQAVAGEDMDIEAFAKKFPAVADGVRDFVTNLGTFGDDQLKTAETGAKVISAIATATQSLPNTGGWWQAIAGEQMDIETFASKFPAVADGINKFVAKLTTLSGDSVKTVDCAINVITSIASLTDIMGDMDTDDAESMNAALYKVLTGLIKTIKVLLTASEEELTTAKARVEAIKEIIAGVKGIDLTALKSFNDSMSTAGVDGITQFINALNGEDPAEKIKAAGAKVLKTYADAAKGEVKPASEKFKSIASSTVGSLDTKDILESASDAGKNVVTGFANGIKNNKKLATDAGSSLGKAALAAAKAALDENSPSKEMYKVGDFAGLGFVNGLDEYADKAYTSGSNMGDSAKTGLSRAIAKISSIVDSDIDSQPTIRPVLDLSDVRSGAGMISGMLGNRRTIAVDGSFAGSIAASMRTNQNGGDSEIVSAIGKLRKDIAEMPRNNYNINGVTYDDGSNVANAVGTIVREIRIGRRT